MSETFDPDAWPHGGSAKKPRPPEPDNPGGGRTNGRPDTPPSPQGNPFDDDDFGFDDDDEPPFAPTKPGSPSASPNRQPTGFPPALRDDPEGWDYEDQAPSSNQYSPAQDYGYSTPGTTTDFDNLYADDDDFNEPTIPDEASTARSSSKQRSDYNDYRGSSQKTKGGYADAYEDDYDNGGYDDLDYDDREPRQSSGGRKFLPALAVVGVLGIVLFFGFQIFGGDGGGSGKGTEQTGGTGKVTAAPQEVTDAVNNALTAWGKFALNGDLSVVKPYFVNDGPQYDRLLAESESFSKNPVAGDPLIYSLKNPLTVQVNNNEWLFRGEVTATRPGGASEKSNWEIRVIRQNDKDPWRVLSIIQFS